MSDLKDKFNLNIWRSFSFIHLRGRFFFTVPNLHVCVVSGENGLRRLCIFLIWWYSCTLRLRTWAQKFVHFPDMVGQLYTVQECFYKAHIQILNPSYVNRPAISATHFGIQIKAHGRRFTWRARPASPRLTLRRDSRTL